MKVAVLGSGGREHALAYKIKQSPKLDELFIIPGNPGTEFLGENVNIDISDKESLAGFCEEKNIDLVVIGPEQPLVDGVSDYLREKGIKVFGPSEKAAAIEGDKAFSKELMKKYNIPTAAFEVFTSGEYKKADEYLKNSKYPLVIKASGLAAGKGVIICNGYEEAKDALDINFKDKKFGSSGDTIVIEEFLEGEEASIFAITDGHDFITLPPSQDHKRIYDNDRGKNTGGMGAYAPAPVVDDDMIERVEKEIVRPTLDAMVKEGRTYNGCLYCGIIITDEGPKVIEFNCRFGDPETQVVLPILKGDFLELLYSAAEGKLDKVSVFHSGGAAICVVAASLGYPDKYDKGFEITGLDKTPDNIVVYHAGTKKDGDKILTNGGRVLGVTSVCNENNLLNCKTNVYAALSGIKFKGIYYRKDIASKAFRD